MTTTPDKVIELQPAFCNNCGSSLKDTGAIKEQSRQIVDVPPVKAIFTEYQTFAKCAAVTVKLFLVFRKG